MARVSTALTLGLAIGRLTPLECERLQGFPNGWTLGVSDSQRYMSLKCGNGKRGKNHFENTAMIRQVGFAVRSILARLEGEDFHDH
jgi:site-specific DNA-cytosine methylase